MKKFSVLMSIYIKDKPEYLEKALCSIWDNQILKPNEIILVKDGLLTKELDCLIQKFSKKKPVKVITLKKNLGLGLALQNGVEHCSYEYIARMDSDDIAYPERFKKQISFLTNNTHIDILGSYISEFNGSIHNIKSVRKVPKNHSEIIKNLRARCPLNHPTVVLRKSALIKAGNYKPFYLKEDIFLWLRLYACNFKFENLTECLLYFRTSTDTYKRRGGYKYAQSELKIFLYRYRIGLINPFQLIFYLSLTLPVRLAPSFLRIFVYKFFLR